MIVRVSVPATTANLGPGFDCLGLALDLCNQITFRVSGSANTIQISGEGVDRLPVDSSNLVMRAAEMVFTKAGRRPMGLHISQENRIPVGSGLGSSAAAVLGGLLAANAVIDSPLGQQELLEMAANMEGHPDNVTPALFGGLTLAVATQAGLMVERLEVAQQRVVVVLPDFDLSTAAARQALPAAVKLPDAVYNIGRVGLLVRAFETNNYGRLAVAMEDRLHQPYRLPLIPGMLDAFSAGRQAGAAAVVLSGAGPSAVAFAADKHDEIAAAMGAAFADAGLRHRSWVLAVHKQGSVIKEQ